MKKVSCIIHQSYLDDVIQTLHETGLMQIIDISKQDEERSELHIGKPNEETTILSDYETRLTTLIKILNTHKRKPSGIKAMLQPDIPEKEPVEDSTLGQLYSYTESVLNPIEEPIRSYQDDYDSLTEQIKQLQDYETQVSWFLSFDFTLDHLDTTDSLIVKAGKTTSLPHLEQKIDDNKDLALFSQPLKTGKNPEWAAIIVGHRTTSKTVERLSAEHLQEISFPKTNETPLQAQKHYQHDIKQKKQRQKDIQSKLQQLSDHHLNQLLAAREQIQLERVRKTLPSQLGLTTATVVIEGWVLAEETTRLQQHLSRVTDDHLIYETRTPKANPDHPPTHLKTPPWAASFKTLLGLFALPKYNELNPTIMMGIFFILFFGFMLGDVGYGSIILILSLIGHIKFGTISPMIKNWSFMGIWLGLTSVIIGILTYSIFGNLIHLIILGEGSSFLYQFSILGMQFPIDSLKNPIMILIAALLLGIIHLNLGVIYGILQAYYNKNYKEMLTEKLCWIPLQIGGGALIGYFILDWNLPEPFYYGSMILVIIGIIQLIYASGPVGFFNITGYVGDWLSYARLLALGLATAGMALAFNVVSQILGEMIPVIGIIVTILLLLVLHTINLAISALGAGVHSLRLQYVELFNRFYTGGGSEFTPFKIKRRYTIKESEQTR